ncbi:MAG: hypothetical protein LH609_10235 [Rudanella sp.]|nr:hypothetical protein [Rudanella sp.]
MKHIVSTIIFLMMGRVLFNVSTTGENAVRIDGANPYVLFRKVNDTGTEYGFIRTWTTNPFNPAAYHGLELGVPPPSAGQPAKHLMFSTNYNLRMVILDNGNVGIGINNPAQKLAVNGAIRARELVVETSGWPDYVFARTYRLRPLAEVEEFINTHRPRSGYDRTTTGVLLRSQHQCVLRLYGDPARRVWHSLPTLNP